MSRERLVKELIETLVENQAHAEALERRRFVRSLGVQPSKLIEGPVVALPELNPDGTLKQG